MLRSFDRCSLHRPSSLSRAHFDLSTKRCLFPPSQRTSLFSLFSLASLRWPPLHRLVGVVRCELFLHVPFAALRNYFFLRFVNGCSAQCCLKTTVAFHYASLSFPLSLRRLPSLVTARPSVALGSTGWMDVLSISNVLRRRTQTENKGSQTRHIIHQRGSSNVNVRAQRSETMRAACTLSLRLLKRRHRKGAAAKCHITQNRRNGTSPKAASARASRDSGIISTIRAKQRGP